MPIETLNQFEAAGYLIDPRDRVTETVPSHTAAVQRKGLSRVCAHVRTGDTLLVTRLDRLGRNALDVRQTLDRLASRGASVVCLDLGNVDLNGPDGSVHRQVLAAAGELERDQQIERSRMVMARSKTQGSPVGRPSSLGADQAADVLRRLAVGESVTAVAVRFSTSRTTIQRLRSRHAGTETTPDQPTPTAVSTVRPTVLASGQNSLGVARRAPTLGVTLPLFRRR